MFYNLFSGFTYSSLDETIDVYLVNSTNYYTKCTNVGGSLVPPYAIVRNFRTIILKIRFNRLLIYYVVRYFLIKRKLFFKFFFYHQYLSFNYQNSPVILTTDVLLRSFADIHGRKSKTNSDVCYAKPAL